MRIDARSGHARIELNFTSPLELLVATILSARTTDRRVNEVTPVLFARYRTAGEYAAADEAELEKVIEPTGYYLAKAKTLIGLVQALCDRFARRSDRHGRGAGNGQPVRPAQIPLPRHDRAPRRQGRRRDDNQS